MAETAEAQRARILDNCDTPAWMYDLALKLGYEPESWSGMWMLPHDGAFQIVGKYVIITEMVSPFKKRVKLRMLPS